MHRYVIPLFAFGVIMGLGYYVSNTYRPHITQAERNYTNELVTESKYALIYGFPDMPTYPGMTIYESYKRVQDGKTDFTGVWLFEGGEEKAIEIIDWYVGEFKKLGWRVEGPFIDEAEDELSIRAQNSKYFIRVMNTERDEGDEGTPGDVILLDIFER